MIKTASCKKQVIWKMGNVAISEQNASANTEAQNRNIDIKDMILTIRGMQVLLDCDVAMLYGYETKAINQSASRNQKRFPPEFRFQLTDEETDNLLQYQFAAFPMGLLKYSNFNSPLRLHNVLRQ